MLQRISLVLLFLILSSQPCSAAVTAFHNKQLWTNQVGTYTTVDFTGWPPNTFIDYQYQHLGVTFPEPLEWIHHSQAYLNDGNGLVGGFGAWGWITIEFATPLHYMGYDFPGTHRLELYSQGTMFYIGPWVGILPTGNFFGVTSSVAFDKARIYNNVGTANIDDLFFQTIPAPGALGVVIVAAMCAAGRRRRCVE
jgi:hypothetical protein